jgi:hypothetical protein
MGDLAICRPLDIYFFLPPLSFSWRLITMPGVTL